MVPLIVDQLQLTRLALAQRQQDQAAAPLLELSSISSRLRWLLHKISFRQLKLEYRQEGIEVPYQITAEGSIRFQKAYPLTLEARVTTPTELGDASASIKGDLASLQASGEFSGPWPLAFDLEAGLLDGDLPWNLELRLGDTSLDLAEGGSLRLVRSRAALQGRGLDIRADLESLARTSQWPGDNRLTAAVHLQQEQLDISKLELQLPQGRIDGSGQLMLGPEYLGKTGKGDYRLDAALQFKNLNPALFVPDSEADLQGRLYGRLEVKLGTLQQNGTPMPEDLALNLTDLSGSFLEQPVQGEGRLDWQRARGLRVASAGLHQGNNRIELSRAWQQGQPVALSFRLPQLDHFSGLLPGVLSGKAEGQLELQVPQTAAGWKELPVGTGRLQLTDVSYDDLTLGAVTARFESTDRQPYAIQASGTSLSYQSQRVDRLELSLRGGAKDFRLTAEAKTPDYGELTLDCRGQAIQHIPTRETSGECARAKWAPLPAWPLEPWENRETVHWIVNLPDRRFTIEPFCMQELRQNLSQKPVVCLNETLAWKDGSARVRGSASYLSWQQIRPLMNGQWEAEGTFAGELQATIANSELADFSASLQSSDSELRLPLAERKLVIDVNRLQTEISGNLHQAQLDLAMAAGAYGQVEGQMVIDRERRLQGSFAVSRLELRTFQPFFIDVTELAGTANGELTLAGTVDKPSVKGEAEVANGSFNHLELPRKLTDISLKTRFDAFRADYQGALTMGDAKADIRGDLDWSETPLKATFALQSEEMEFTPLPQTDIWIVPDIKAEYRGGQLHISGSVKVPQAFINIKSLPKNSVGISSDVVIVDAEDAQTRETPVYASVNMQLGDSVLFRGFGLETHLKGAMRLEYSPQQLLQGNGVVQLVEGTYRAYGQNLKIRSGELIFVGPIDNPTIHVDAVRADITDAVTVGIRAEGPAKSPSVTLFSQPAMSDQKKLHYLVTGQAPGEGQQDSSALLSQAAVSLGAATGESVLQDYADKLGIRNFQITAGEGDSGTEVQLSGYVNPRLFVRYGMGMFEDVNSLTMRYKLRRNLFLEAVSSTASTLDLLWTFQVGEQKGKK